MKKHFIKHSLLASLLFAVAAPLLFSSCSEHNDPTKKEPVVYMAGSYYTKASAVELPVYWKGTEMVQLSDKNGFTSSIYVSNGDVYVAGGEYANTNFQKAMYWKNGVAVSLTDGSTSGDYAYDIFVSGSDVYVSGSVYDADRGVRAVYWKNGTRVDLNTPCNCTNEARATGITVSGDDVYVAGWGYELDDRGHSIPTLYSWKNGTATKLIEGTETTDITVSGGNVYVAGRGWFSGTQVGAKYWKNGTPVTVSASDATYDAANAIFVSGTDVYVAGFSDDGTAKYWKNGTAVTIASGIVGNNNSGAELLGIYAAGNDVYVGGREYSHEFSPDNKITTTTSTVSYWKNGKRTVLKTVTAEDDEVFASSMFVVE